MSIENTIILSAAAFGSFYLCATSLKEMHNNKCWLPFYHNCLVFGFSLGTIRYIVRHIKF
jgi:hypothetical protein